MLGGWGGLITRSIPLGWPGGRVCSPPPAATLGLGVHQSAAPAFGSQRGADLIMAVSERASPQKTSARRDWPVHSLDLTAKHRNPVRRIAAADEIAVVVCCFY